MSKIYLALLPELILGVGALVLLMRGAFASSDQEDGLRAVALLGVALLAAIFFTDDGGARLFEGAFIADAYAQFFKIVVMIGAAASIWIARGESPQKSFRFEYSVLIILATMGMMLMVSSGDMMLFYIGIELQSLSLYVLAAWDRDRLRSAEAGLKYFVLGGLASGLLLYGLSLLYGATGSTDFAAFARAPLTTQAPLALMFGVIFFLAGMAFKLSAAPFHMWTPDVYEGAPTPVTAFFASVPKLAALAVLLRLMVLTPESPDAVLIWQQIIMLLALTSMLVGALGAIAQTNIKRLMAYGSIGHMGYVLLGIAAAPRSGAFAVMLYAVIYMVMTLGVFAMIAAIRRKGHACERIVDLAGLAQTQPLPALMMLLLLFSMAGIPPLAGFFAKYYVFMAALEAGFVYAVIFAVITSVIACFYYLWIIKIIYMDDPVQPLDPIPAGLRNLAVLAGLAVTAFVIFPGPRLIDITARAAQTLMP